MSKSKKQSVLTTEVKKIDRKQLFIDGHKATLQKMYAEFTGMILKEAKVKKVSKANIEKEVNRLIAYAKKAINADGYKVTDKNVWSAVKNLIIKNLAGSMTVTIEAGKDVTTGKVIKEKVLVSSLPETARGMQQYASTIKKAAGMSDSRSTNTPATKTRAPQQTKGAPPATHSTATAKGDWVKSMGFAFKVVKSGKNLMEAIIHHREQITKLGLALGYVISIEKKAKK